MVSSLGDACACGQAYVCPSRLVACCTCWDRIEGVERRLTELGIIVEVREVVGGSASLAFALSRNDDKPARQARGRLIRAVWDRLRPRGFARAEVCFMLGQSVDTFTRALREA